LHNEIAIRDFPIESGPSIVHDACQEIRKGIGIFAVGRSTFPWTSTWGNPSENQDRQDLDCPSARTGGKGSGAFRVLFIGVLDDKEIVHQEIATRDFPMRSEPFMMKTRVRRSRGFGVRQFGILDDKKLTTGGIAKSRNATVH
jgi:hypothetical protein